MPHTSLSLHRFHILLALADHTLHGTAIMEEVLNRTRGKLRLWPGTLYGTLRGLAEDGFVREVDPPPGAPTERGKRRFYQITPGGRRLLEEEVSRLAELVRHAKAKRVLRGPKPA
jgi:DNA-binding PadR family transcriptional regulator